MKTSTKHVLGLGAMLCASTCLASPAMAAYDLYAAPPAHQLVDRNGVGLTTGLFSTSERPVAIGPNASDGLFYVRDYIGHGWRHNFVVTLAKNPQNLIYTVSFGGDSRQFAQQSDGTFYPLDQAPTRLIANGDGSYTYYTVDGTRVTFDHYNGTKYQYDSNEGLVSSITNPGGVTIRFTYHETDHPGSCGGCYVGHRLQSVSNNLGYQLKFEYPAVSDQVTTDQQFNDWTNIVKVTAFNMAVDKCDTSEVSCTFTQTWPSATYATPSSTTSTTTDALNRKTTYSYSGDQITQVKSPLNVTETIAYDSTSNLITGTTTPAGSWTYDFTVNQNATTAVVTDPASNSTTVQSDKDGRITSETDALNNTTTYVYDSPRTNQKHLKAIIRPGGSYVGSGVYTDATSFGYDSRGNVNLITAFPKSGSGLSATTVQLTFPADTDSQCSGTGAQVRCNRPTAIVDPNGNETDFTYHSSGAPKKITSPAPLAGKPQPQTVYDYSDPGLTAYFWQKNTGGTYQILAGEGTVIRPISVSRCMTGSANGTGCVSTSDGSKTTFDYGNTSGSVATNLLPASVTRGSGDGALAATTGFTWTSDGDLSTVDGPLGTTSDTTAYFYDAVRQRTGVIGPRPDGNGGTANFRAIRYIYNNDGQVTEVDRGSTTA